MKPPVRIPRWACRRSSTVMTRWCSSVAAEQTSRPCLFAGQPKCACSPSSGRFAQTETTFEKQFGGWCSKQILIIITQRNNYFDETKSCACVSGCLLLRHDADAGAAVRREVGGPRGHVRELRRAQLREPGWMGGWMVLGQRYMPGTYIYPSLSGAWWAHAVAVGGVPHNPTLTQSLTLALTLTN